MPFQAFKSLHGLGKVRFVFCRWMRLNNSLERLSAVHDGDLGVQNEEAGNDAAGIRLDMVHDVTGTQGWELASMSQLPSAGGILLLDVNCVSRCFFPFPCEIAVNNASRLEVFWPLKT